MIPANTREFIKVLEENGDLVRIKSEVDWDLEAGAIIRKVCEDGEAAPFFEKIKDYPGHRYLGAPLATYRRLAAAFGLPLDSHVSKIGQEYLKRSNSESLGAVMVERDKAPCKENIFLNDEVDLLAQVPSPMVHDGDGGRYLGTWHVVVTKDPVTQAVNWGMYRLMVYGKQGMAGLVLPFSDMGKTFYEKFVPYNKPMPFAMVISPDPLSAIAASAPVQGPELDLASQLLKQQIRLVKCETNDLEVPADAEIIIEGEVLPDIKVEEGPFGEYTGFRTSLREPRTVFKVNAITHRNNPITTISNLGIPTDEGHLCRAFSISVEAEQLLKSQGLPVKAAFMPPVTCQHLLIVSVKTNYNNIATQIGHLIFGSKLGLWTHQVLVVDASVNIYDINEVLHAFSTQMHPARGIRVYEHGVASPLAPFLSPLERKEGRGVQVVFDCTFPLDWDEEYEKPLKVSFNNIYPQHIKEKVLRNWSDYGYTKDKGREANAL